VWVPIAAGKDDDPIGIRPFDAITFSLGERWPQRRSVRST